MKCILALVLSLTVGVCAGQLAVDTEDELVVGGIRQFITIQAKDTTHPILLFLHGGPGGSVMSYAHKFTDRLRQHFVVVQWDQRETGRTLVLNKSPEPLSLALFQNDTEQLIEALLARFGRQKLYLVGHSWGTALGFHITKKRPELLHAYISIGAMTDQTESERVALELMLEKARQKENHKALKELAKVHVPFENGEQLYYHRKWLQEYSGARPTLSRDYVERWATIWLDVFNEASKDNLIETLPEIACPVYFFAGKNDYQTNSWIAEKYHQVLKAPRKGFYWFDTGHSIPNASPARMQAIIVDEILPATLAKSTF